MLYHVRGYQGRQREAVNLAAEEIRDVAASFQAACVDVLVEKIRRAARRYSARSVIIGGGVSANSGLRKAMAKFPLPVFFPPMQYCTDNAAMIAGLAARAIVRREKSAHWISMRFRTVNSADASN